MGDRLLHHLMIGLYAPTPATPAPTDENPNPVAPPTPAPVILSCSVPEPSASRLREGLAGASQEIIPGTILTYLSQAFQRCDEITHNPPTAPIPDTPVEPEYPAVTVALDDLVAIAEGRKIVLLDDGHPVIVTPEEAAKLDLGQGGDTNFIGGPVGGSMAGSDSGADPLGGGSTSPSSDSSGEAPAPLSGGEASGNGSASGSDGSTATTSSETDGSVAGEKHSDNAGTEGGAP